MAGMESFANERNQIRNLALIIRQCLQQNASIESKISTNVLEYQSHEIEISKLEDQAARLQSYSSTTGNTDAQQHAAMAYYAIKVKRDRMMAISAENKKLEGMKNNNNTKIESSREILANRAVEFEAQSGREEDSAKVLKYGANPALDKVSKMNYGHRAVSAKRYATNKMNYRENKGDIFKTLMNEAKNAMKGIVPGEGQLTAEFDDTTDDGESGNTGHASMSAGLSRGGGTEMYSGGGGDTGGGYNGSATVYPSNVQADYITQFLEGEGYANSESQGLENFAVGRVDVNPGSGDLTGDADMTMANMYGASREEVQKYREAQDLGWAYYNGYALLVPNSIIQQRSCQGYTDDSMMGQGSYLVKRR